MPCFCLGPDWLAKGGGVEAAGNFLRQTDRAGHRENSGKSKSLSAGNVGFIIKLRVKETILKLLLGGLKLKLYITASAFFLLQLL